MSTTKTVDEITQLHLEGNVTPRSWYQRITWQDGKADLAAITILSDVVYWYRATKIEDPDSGKFLHWEKRFKDDKLQRSYQQLADMFGLTKEQARDACHRLKDAGLVTLELRTIQIPNGLPCSNVLYIEPVVEKVREITYHVEKTPLSTSTCTPLSTSTCTPPPLDVDTYTKITTKTKEILPIEKDQSAKPTALSPAGGEFFKQWHRKRWHTQAEKELFESTEKEVSSAVMLAAVQWGAVSGIANVKSICTRAKNMAKEKRPDALGSRPAPKEVLGSRPAPKGTLNGKGGAYV